MNGWRRLISIMLSIGLCACATQKAAERAPVVERKAFIKPVNLPCSGEIEGAEAAITFPSQSLYQNGAVLPGPTGLNCLNSLSEWLKDNPLPDWTITVSGEAGFGFDPLALAEKRQQLLQGYLQRQGIETNRWEWRSAADQSAQLRLDPPTGSP